MRAVEKIYVSLVVNYKKISVKKKYMSDRCTKARETEGEGVVKQLFLNAQGMSSEDGIFSIERHIA